MFVHNNCLICISPLCMYSTYIVHIHTVHIYTCTYVHACMYVPNICALLVVTCSLHPSKLLVCVEDKTCTHDKVC